MENKINTTITKTLTSSQMKIMFLGGHEQMKILAYFSIMNGNSFKNSEKFQYKICIEHFEGTCAKKLFSNVFCKIFSAKNKENKLER